MHSALVGLNNKLYKMCDTYIKVVEVFFYICDFSAMENTK
jgi:hypothetical protein